MAIYVYLSDISQIICPVEAGSEAEARVLIEDKLRLPPGGLRGVKLHVLDDGVTDNMKSMDAIIEQVMRAIKRDGDINSDD